MRIILNGKNHKGEILSNTKIILPRRGEIWLVDFEPTVGAEIRKERPAIVVSSDDIGKLPIKLVAPITSWKPDYFSNMWLVKIIPNDINGLEKISAVDTLQLRGVDKNRFIHKIGRLSPNVMEEIVMAIAIVIEYQ